LNSQRENGHSAAFQECRLLIRNGHQFNPN
jgi:hypothetical protein